MVCTPYFMPSGSSDLDQFIAEMNTQPGVKYKKLLNSALLHIQNNSSAVNHIQIFEMKWERTLKQN